MSYIILKRAVVLALFILPATLTSQSTGRLVGQILDSESGGPLGDARVTVLEDGSWTKTAIDGRYVLRDLTAGSLSIRVTRIGYSPKVVTGIQLEADDVLSQDITLVPSVVELMELTVTASAEAGSVNSALDEQRNSVAIVNAISSEQIARSPDGDAAAAVQRVSGATVQDGKYLFVRGLGDRYTQASLNGARIPSPEPERKVVPLDLFPTSLLSGITTSKTFTPDQPGDFSGGSINIKTREFVGKNFLKISTSTSLNDVVTGKDAFFAPSVGGDWLISGGDERSLPAGFPATDFSQPISSATSNSLVRSLRNNWSPVMRSAAPNGSVGISTGGTIPTAGTGISYVISGSYNNSSSLKSEHTRALAAALSSGEAEEQDRFTGATGIRSVQWGGIANLSTTFGGHTKLSLNNTYNRTMDNEGRREFGSSENLGLPLRIDRLKYVERSIRSTQLALSHSLADGKLGIDWGATFAGVTRDEPDRSEIVYTTEGGNPEWYGFSNEAAVRTFAALDENSVEGNLNFQLALGEPWMNRFIRVGGVYRNAERDAKSDVYSISLSQFLPEDGFGLAPEEIFPTYSADGDGYFRVSPLGQGGNYTASDNLLAGYAMFVSPLGSSFDLVAGARIEHSTVEVLSAATDGTPSVANPEFTDILPSLSLTWRPGERSNVRASASRTLSRPEYRELSPIIFREVIGFDAVKGNPDLERALITNLDLRWEFYPSRGEIISVSLFAKQFDRPIERIYQGTSGTRIITYVNTLGANNYGVELEARKSLRTLSQSLSTFSLFANATVMKSEIELDPGAGSVTNSNRKMVGQAPYVINAGLTWNHPWANASATLLYNRVGERITEAGEQPLPDVVINPRDVLDFSLRFPIVNTLEGKLDAKNILNAAHVTQQGDVIRESYRSGRTFSMGFSWAL